MKTKANIDNFEGKGMERGRSSRYNILFSLETRSLVPSYLQCQCYTQYGVLCYAYCCCVCAMMLYVSSCMMYVCYSFVSNRSPLPLQLVIITCSDIILDNTYCSTCMHDSNCMHASIALAVARYYVLQYKLTVALLVVQSYTGNAMLAEKDPSSSRDISHD